MRHDNPLMYPYLGASCAECGKKYETSDDLMGTRFGLVPDVVCDECWTMYAIKRAMQWLDIVELVYENVTPVSSEQGVIVLSREQITMIERAIPHSKLRYLEGMWER